jgi:RNA-directed DNA polymerase
MKVSYGEGLATHTGPESCAGAGNRGGEALTGERAGWVSSRENHAPRKRVLRGADAVEAGGRQHRARRHREARRDPARSKTPCMHGSISHGNREIPWLSVAHWATDRIGNPEGKRR